MAGTVVVVVVVGTAVVVGVTVVVVVVVGTAVVVVGATVVVVVGTAVVVVGATVVVVVAAVVAEGPAPKEAIMVFALEAGSQCFRHVPDSPYVQ